MKPRRFARHRRPEPAPPPPTLDRAIHELLIAIRDEPAESVGRRTGLSGQTIRNMRSTKTKYPRHTTLERIARAVGLEFRLLRSNQTTED